MSRHTGDHLPEILFGFIRDGAAYREGGKAVPIISVDEDGFPHVAIVNCVVATDPRTVRVPVAPNSSSFKYLMRTGTCTIVVVEPGYLFYIKGAVEKTAPKMACHAGLAAVTVKVTGVWSDSEKFYEMVSGMTYTYREHEVNLRQLEEKIIAELSKPSEVV